MGIWASEVRWDYGGVIFEGAEVPAWVESGEGDDGGDADSLLGFECGSAVGRGRLTL